MHRKHGDYLTSLFVSHGAGQPVDAAHFRHIGDAYGAARDGRLARGELQSAACRITIAVAGGEYRGTGDADNTDKSLEHFPLVVDVPDITLRGALVMKLDARGRATGVGATEATTTLSPIAPMSDALLSPWATPPARRETASPWRGSPFGRGSARGADPVVGTGVLTFAVNNVLIQGNRLEGFLETLDLRGSSGVVKANHISAGGQCDLCIAGPGTYRVADNRLLAGGTHGIFASPAIDSDPSIAARSAIVADIVNNEVRDHRQQPISAGIRIGAVASARPTSTARATSGFATTFS